MSPSINFANFVVVSYERRLLSLTFLQIIMKTLKRTLLATFVMGTSLTAFSQSRASGDADWCHVIERILSDNGVAASAVCDMQNGQRTVHLTIGDQMRRYAVAAQGQRSDYSSPVQVIIDEPVWKTPARRGAVQRWHGNKSYKADEVYEEERDYTSLYESLKQAVRGVARIQVIDADFAEGQQYGVDDAPLVLRTSIIDLQRAYEFEKPKEEGAGRRGNERINQYLAYAEVGLSLVNSVTGEIVWNTTASKSDRVGTTFSDPMNYCIKDVCNAVVTKLKNMYPSQAPRRSVKGDIIESGEVNAKKEKVEQVYINLGSGQEISKGDTFDVLLDQEVAGQQGSVVIGSVQVQEVRGAGLSLCKVKKGEKEIYQAILNKGVLHVMSTW